MMRKILKLSKSFEAFERKSRLKLPKNDGWNNASGQWKRSFPIVNNCPSGSLMEFSVVLPMVEEAKEAKEALSRS